MPKSRGWIFDNSNHCPYQALTILTMNPIDEVERLANLSLPTVDGISMPSLFLFLSLLPTHT